MRDPTTTIDIDLLEDDSEVMIEIVRQLLCDRSWAELLGGLHELVRPPRKRGRPPRVVGRELQIASVIASVVKTGKFKPTRSHAKRRGRRPASACSIVQAALARLGEHQSERSIEDIWSRRRDWSKRRDRKLLTPS